MDIKKTNIFKEMPHELIGKIMCKLPNKDAINFRNTSAVMRGVYNHYRKSISGPHCDAYVTLQNNTIRYGIRYIEDSINSSRVPADHWESLFTNAVVGKFFLRVENGELTNEQIEKIFHCYSIEELRLNGGYFTQTLFDSLRRMSIENISVRVEKWIDNMAGGNNLTCVYITEPLENFTDISEVIKTTPKLNVKFKYHNMLDNIDVLKAIPTGSIDIVLWEFYLFDGLVSPNEAAVLFTTVCSEVFRISGTDTNTSMEQFGAPSSHRMCFWKNKVRPQPLRRIV